MSLFCSEKGFGWKNYGMVEVRRVVVGDSLATPRRPASAVAIRELIEPGKHSGLVYHRLAALINFPGTQTLTPGYGTLQDLQAGIKYQHEIGDKVLAIWNRPTRLEG